MGVVGDVKIRNDAEHTLPLFVLDLGFADFDAGKCDLHVGDIGGDRQGDLRDEVDFSWVQGSRRGLRGETRRGNCELESTGSYVGKGEFPLSPVVISLSEDWASPVLVSFTCAPAITAPLWSTTVPLMLPSAGLGVGVV